MLHSDRKSLALHMHRHHQRASPTYYHQSKYVKKAINTILWKKHDDKIYFRRQFGGTCVYRSLLFIFIYICDDYRYFTNAIESLYDIMIVSIKSHMDNYSNLSSNMDNFFQMLLADRIIENDDKYFKTFVPIKGKTIKFNKLEIKL